MIKNQRTVGTIAGINIGFHWTALIAGIVIAYTLATSVLPLLVTGSSTTQMWTAGIIGAAAMGLSVIAHELGHSLAARRHGVGTHFISLWLLGGVAQLEKEAPTARGAGEIAVAGPVVSVAVGVMAAAVAGMAALLDAPPIAIGLLAWLALVNVGMAVFNMVPAFPLDGGRFLQAVMWHRSGDQHRSTIRSSRLGSFLGGLMVLAGLVQLLTGTGSGISLLLIGLFVRRAAAAERRRARIISRFGPPRAGFADQSPTDQPNSNARPAADPHHGRVRPPHNVSPASEWEQQLPLRQG